MKYNKLGQTDINVSELCLGTMTWGTQNTQDEAFYQADTAVAAGVNFIDTAQMYPVNPLSAGTQGDSERILGNWLAQAGRREKVVVATKVAGNGVKYIRDGADITRDGIMAAIDASLTSLKTDYIDLYQLHWPNRGSYHFRQNWSFDPSKQDKAKVLENMSEVLETCAELEKAGKVRSFGLSNESAWGTAQWLRLAEDRELPRMASIQNEYSLLCRLFDTDLAELCHNENVSLLPFSPLATGILSGQYLDGAMPAGSRATVAKGLGGRMQPRMHTATQAYADIAAKHGVNLVQMALAWCCTRPSMTSAIFGARTAAQLDVILKSVDVTLSVECLRDIEDAHKAHPMPY